MTTVRGYAHRALTALRLDVTADQVTHPPTEGTLMDTRHLLHDTFVVHEVHAPDAESAWRRLNAELADPGY